MAPLVRSASMSAKPIVAYALSETDRHTPLMNSTDTTTAIGVCGPSSPHSTKVTAVATPFASSTVRKPKRRSSGSGERFDGDVAREHRDEHQAGGGRAPAEGALEHQGQQERHGGDRRAEQRATRVRHPEGVHLQGAEVEQRASRLRRK